jgi:hexosaminidase
MKNSSRLILLATVLLFTVFQVSAQVSVIPYPAKVDLKEGHFKFNAETTILYESPSLQAMTNQAIKAWKKPLGFELKSRHFDNENLDNKLFLRLLQPVNLEIGPEGYSLEINQGRILLSANSPAGIRYGLQTIGQMLDENQEKTLPNAVITDFPRFAYRGMHLDVSRHFMPIEFVYKVIDYLEMHKMNVFHWHLIDDQGWRIEIKKYPKLTEIGAFRENMPDIHWNERPLTTDRSKATYGGFYTQEEIIRLVAYANERNITVIPEIELPAHVMSALAAYPEYSCTGENLGVPPGGVWPITHIYCAGKEETFHFLEDVLTEVMALFPSRFIHIGGDEADKTNWESCPKCQERIKNEGLKDEHELQSYFIHRIEKFLNSHGRSIIGWDEILEGGLAPNATVMSWRGVKGGIEAAKMGHKVVMTPGTHCYFDHYQGDPATEPLAIGGFTTLKKVYHYEPIPEELSEEEGKFVLGAQANHWTEYMPDPKQVEYMMFPRLSALSEVLWSPKETRNWSDFSKRMKMQYQRYKNKGINYAESIYQVSAKPVLDIEDKSLLLTLESEVFEPEIRYTLNGDEPSVNSALYKEPIKSKESTVLKAAVFEDGKRADYVLSREFVVHKAFAKKVVLEYPNSKQYDGQGSFGLVNGIKGSPMHSDGTWKGFLGKDLIATIDLGEPTKVNSIEVDALHQMASWIFFPLEVKFEVSANGIDFDLVSIIQNDVPPLQKGNIIKVFKAETDAENIRFVRVSMQNISVAPPGHSGEGSEAWLFASEIIVN